MQLPDGLQPHTTTVRQNQPLIVSVAAPLFKWQHVHLLAAQHGPQRPSAKEV